MKIRKYEKCGDLGRIILVESIDDYNKVISQITGNEGAWYRGVSNATYRLIPKGYRNIVVIADQFGRYVGDRRARSSTSGDKYLLPDFIEMLDTFKTVVKDDIDCSVIKNEIDWLFVAQHYGLPTPLLDWTTDMNVAEWFATGLIVIRARWMSITLSI